MKDKYQVLAEIKTTTISNSASVAWGGKPTDIEHHEFLFLLRNTVLELKQEIDALKEEVKYLRSYHTKF